MSNSWVVRSWVSVFPESWNRQRSVTGTE
jgi:hypothetical protein